MKTNSDTTTKAMTDVQLARQLNDSAHMGGQMTEYGVWYADNARLGCLTYPLGSRRWTARAVQAYREDHTPESR